MLLAAEAGAEWHLAKKLNAAEVDISLLQDEATVQQLNSNGCHLDITLTPIPYQGLRQGKGTLEMKGQAVKSRAACHPLIAPFTFNSDYTYQAVGNNAGSYFGTLTLEKVDLTMPGESQLTGSIILKNVPAKPSATWLASAITNATLLVKRPPATLVPAAWRATLPPVSNTKNYTLTYQGQVPVGIIGLYYPPGLKIEEQ